jgi:3,4-dihydroxy 2-butanone 4-phosphate synthase/GTP cyclohydrolase II
MLDHWDDFREKVGCFAAGKPLVLWRNREPNNLAYIILAAKAANVRDIEFLMRHSVGEICIAASKERLEALRLPIVKTVETSFNLVPPQGISDLAPTHSLTRSSAKQLRSMIRDLADPFTEPDDLELDDILFIQGAKWGGVQTLPGPVEAVVDMCRLAGHIPVGVVGRLAPEGGATREWAEAFAQRHALPLLEIEELAERRRQHHAEPAHVAREVRLPTKFGQFRMHLFEDHLTGQQHVAMVKGEVQDNGPVLVRLHSECLTGDIFGSHKCDCGPQLELALQRINESGHGVLLYLRQEGRGIGLENKLRAYTLQDQGYDTVDANLHLGLPAELRDYRPAAMMLRELGIGEVNLLTNNPAKISGLTDNGIAVKERVSLAADLHEENTGYLKTKIRRMNHKLIIPD